MRTRLPNGEAGETARNALIREALSVVGQVHSGESLLVPGEADMARALGRTRGFLTHGSSYQEKLEKATGLTVIHRGLVLAGNVRISPLEIIQDRTPRNLVAVGEAVSQLSSEDKAKLIGRLASQLARDYSETVKVEGQEVRISLSKA